MLRHMTPAARRRARQPHQLPPGRHGLPRAFVASNQRERILDAVADVASLAGYASMSVEGIIATAGVSRRTFYDHFADKQEAFLAAYDAIVALLVERVQNAFLSNTTFAGRVRDCLAAFLTFLAIEPRFADMCIVEVLAAGPEAVERRNGVMRAMAGLIQSRRRRAQGRPEAAAPDGGDDRRRDLRGRLLESAAGQDRGPSPGAPARSRLFDDASVHRTRRRQARGSEGSQRHDARARGRLSASLGTGLCLGAPPGPCRR